VLQVGATGIEDEESSISYDNDDYYYDTFVFMVFYCLSFQLNY
jgi:hypothetical protein